MNAIIFGATGMIGSGVLLECIEDDRMESVLVIGRSSCNIHHPKLREVLHQDFFNYDPIKGELSGYDTCFFCLGVSSAGKSEADYTRLTYDLTLAAAEALASVNEAMTFCYVSGAGTDSTEKGRIMWARVKGRTENALLRLPFKNAYMFRPAFIQPMKGVRSKTMLYQALYAVLGPISPVLKVWFPNYMTTSEAQGRAMIEVALKGYKNRIISCREINEIAQAAE